MLINRLRLLRCLKASLPRLPVLFKPQRSFTLDSTPILKQTSDSLEVTASVSGKPVSGKFHYVWLRDHCPCPLCVHEHNRQKLHSSADVNVDVTPQSIRLLPSEASVEIVWPQHSLRSQPGAGNHVSQIPIKWLLEHSYQKSLASFKPAASKPVLWTAKDYEEKGVRVHYDDYMNTTSGLLKVLEQLRDYGLAFLTNVPTDNHKEVENVAKRIGCIRETFYGTSWDVKSVPKAKNIAYTSLDLGLHMDLMYFEAPPGVQMLHSLANTVKGGQSTFLDVFKAVEILKTEFPEDYEVLKKVPITFHYQNDGHSLHFRRPTIIDNDLNDGLKVFYAPPFQGQLEMDEDLVKPFYKSFASFSKILQRTDLVYRTLLKKGDLVIFHNRRALHGRDEFDPFSGERHYKGTYVDWDDFKDKLRITLDSKE